MSDEPSRTATEQIAALQSQLATAKMQLEGCQRELEAFAYAVSHDLRAPLRSLSGFSQALSELPLTSDPKAQHYLNRIQQASSKMSELIDALLSLARISRADLFMRPCSLTAIATEASAAVRAKYPNRNISIDIAPDLQVSGDTRLLRMAFDALLENACKFTATREQACISVTRAMTDRGAAFCVADNGIGFDMSYADKLFKPFQKLHGDEQLTGVGIGLAAVQRIIARHGGAAWAHGQPDVGAQVFFTLPT